MTKNTYTFNECYALLGVDPKTFRRWLKKADINPDAQRSKLDERIRFLTQQQVDQLAADHGRTLTPAAEQSATESATPGAIKLLIENLREQIENLSTQGERHGRIWQDLLAKIEHQTERISTLEKQLTEAQEAIVSAQAPKRATKAKSAPETGESLLPEGLIPWRTFASLHRVPETTAGRHIANGFIPIVKGRWKVGNGYVKEALDTEGRREFWVQCHTNGGFTPCDDCPHEFPYVEADVSATV